MPELIPPIDIPWKLIDVSQDMIDPGFCDNAAPTCFKSSIAVFAYEPSQSEIPIEMCGEKLTYLKVTISLTGYQLQTDDWSRLEGIVSTFSSGELRTILGDYLACYGAMVHISTFPPQDTITDLTLFPHIVDFEPKLRELLQVTSETGEVLTGSQSSISVDKSFSRTHGNEVGLEHSGKYKSPESNAGSFEASHTIKGTWKDSTTESFQVNADASRERSERQSTRTDLNQMYNLLTGYHSGTNRALFLILARPHTLQPTNRRTFVQGVRYIEGIQDFFLIVRRPGDMEGLRIEVHVDTGHFPEDATINVKQPSFDTREITLHITVIAVGTGEFSNPSQIVNVERHGFEIDGWQFDPTRGDVGRGGVSFERDSFDSGMHPSDVKSRDYHVVSPDTFLFSALIQRGFNADDDTWTLTFHIYLRRPRPETRPAVADLGNLMIFRRTLCTAMRSGDPCPLRAPEWLPLDSLAASFMGELPVQINNDIALDVFSGTGGSFQDSLRREVQSLLTLPDRIKQYYPQNNLDLVDSDYFKDRLVARLPESTLMTPIHQLNWISKDIVNKLGPNVTIKDLLSYSLYDLAKRLSLPVYDAATLRGKILGITPKK